MATTKQELRTRFKAMRSSIPADERTRIDRGITDQVLGLPEYEQADVLFAYLSFGTEIETRDIIRDAWSRGKTVALPRCIPGTRDMAFHRVESLDNLVKSKLGVEEPAEDPATLIDPTGTDGALVLVPGMTFDARGYRLGYGGGFYDVLLSQFQGVSVGLCRECQLSDRVEALDEHDLPAQIVVTENAVLRS